MPVIAAAIHDQHVAGAQLAERVMDDGGVGADKAQGDCGAGDARNRHHRADCRFHEADVAEVPDRRGLGSLQQCEQRGVDGRRKVVEYKHFIVSPQAAAGRAVR
jgi:hypothetical protein